MRSRGLTAFARSFRTLTLLPAQGQSASAPRRSEMLGLDIGDGMADRFDTFLELVRKRRRTEKIAGRIVAMPFGSEPACFGPVLAAKIAAPDPKERDHIDRLIL